MKAARVVLVLAAGALLVANGACALVGVAGLSPSRLPWHEVEVAVLGLGAFVVSIVLALVALPLLVRGRDPRKPLLVALLLGALGTGVVFFLLVRFAPLPRSEPLLIGLFGAGALLAAALLALTLARPRGGR